MLEDFDIIKYLKTEDCFPLGEQILIRVDKGNSLYNGVMHRHTFVEIVYVISGKARYCLNDKSYMVHKGDLIIINSGVPHTFASVEDNEEEFTMYDLIFTTDNFSVINFGKNDYMSLGKSYLFCSFVDDELGREDILNIMHDRNEEFLDLFKKIYAEYQNRKKGFMNMIRALLIELITIIFRQIDDRATISSTYDNRQIINKAISYMQQNFNTQINLDSIVADLFLSKNYFRQLFKSTTGISITDYIQGIRIDEAKRLLKETDRTVYDIAGTCGFGDLKFFYKTFKKIVGTTPNEYRKNTDTLTRKDTMMITKTELHYKTLSDKTDATFTEELLMGEIANVNTYYHFIKANDILKIKKKENVFNILFLISGKVCINSNYVLEGKMLFVDSFDNNIEINSIDDARIFHLEKIMNETDLETLKRYNPKFPIINNYFECEQYTDSSKTPKTINRIVLEQGSIPRFAMGSVESVGEDYVIPNSHPEIDQFFFTFPENDTELIINGETMNLLGDTILHIPLGADHGTNLAKDKRMHYLWIDCLVDEKYTEILETDHVKTGEMKSF